MHLLDVAVTQHSFQNHLGKIRAQTPIYGKVSSRPFNYGNEKRLSSSTSTWKLLETTKNLNFGMRHHEMTCGRFVVKAVATLEPKSMVKIETERLVQNNSKLSVADSILSVQLESSSKDSAELEEREKLRRMRISKSNKGNRPWNKGRKHSPETLQRIREKTRLAMQNPKVKMKLANFGHAQSDETKMKIGAGVRMGWQKRRQKQLMQESCNFGWQNLIAETASQGYDGEEELQWDSYKILHEKHEEEWLESVEQRKSMSMRKGSRRAPKPLEHRRKISQAIYRKWADPEYRGRVCSALAKFHGIPPGTERKPRKTPNDATQSLKRKPMKKTLNEANNSSQSEIKFQSQQSGKRKAPPFKDPSASSKLEMIKNIKAQRTTAETKKAEVIKRARLLIAEAEKAAKALEIPATKSPIAQAALIESRKLIAQAVQSLESIDADHPISEENDREPSAVPDELKSQAAREIHAWNGILSEANGIKINGIKALATIKDEEESDFSKSTLHDIFNDEKELIPKSSSGYGLSPSNSENQIKQTDSRDESEQSPPNAYNTMKQEPQPSGAKVETPKEEKPSNSIAVKKKWVRGRLVEVAEVRNG